MASTVLGKRTRSSNSGRRAYSETSSHEVAAPPSKRQTRSAPINDENQNPFTEAMDADIAASVLSTPRKHGVRAVVTPTKRFRKDDLLLTPTTPRHKDVFAPETPRHRVMVPGQGLTTPRTPSTPSSHLSTVYSSARQLFLRSAEPGELVGRDAERQELTEFMTACVESRQGGCTYVSGPPGTGKSAMVSRILEGVRATASVKKTYINCMSIKTSRELCSSLLVALDSTPGEDQEVKALQEIFVPRQKTAVYIVVLDEIDHILTLDLEILYRLFEWSMQKASSLILIGIANALDLTNRFLPRLKSLHLKPHLVPFLPYTAPQIKAVITSRLMSLAADASQLPFLHPAAIELCARKVASQSGDLRKAFDICRRAIDMVESETKRKHQAALEEQLMTSPSRKPLGDNMNLSSPKAAPTKSLAQSLATLTVESAPRASIAHVNKVTAMAFGNGASQRLKTLNLQQKAALCALVAMEKKKRAAALTSTPSKSRAAPTVKALFDAYCLLCKQDAILHPLTSIEFRDVIGSLETLSLISPVDGKHGSFLAMGSTPKRGRKGGFGSGAGLGDERQVASCVGEKEVSQAVDGLGAGILKAFLAGAGLD